MPRPNVYQLPCDSAVTPRLLPGPELAPRDAAIFAALVASRDPSHFCESDRALLNATARAIGVEQDVAEARDGAPFLIPGKNGPQPNPLIAMQREQARLIASLLTRLRMTPQSRMSKDKAATTAQGGEPNLSHALHLARTGNRGHDR